MSPADVIVIAAVSCLIHYNDSVDRNFERIEHWSRQAAEAGADVVLFNETSVNCYWQNPGIRKEAETLDGPIIQRLTALAKELDLVICAGMAEKAGAKVHNTQVLVGPEGLIGRHRKSSFASGEEQYFDIGDDRDVFDVNGIKIGIAICFESIQPDTCKALKENGAEIILAPYANGVNAQDIADGKRPYFNKRAQENGVWYVAVDQCAYERDAKTLRRTGAACFVNPEGEIVDVTPVDQVGEHMIVRKIEIPRGK